MNPHERIDRRSLAMHELIANKIQQDPGLLEISRRNIDRWLQQGNVSVAALLEWKSLLDSKDVAEVLRVLRSADENAARLRQSSPFAGILTEEERCHIISEYDAGGA